MRNVRVGLIGIAIAATCVGAFAQQAERRSFIEEARAAGQRIIEARRGVPVVLGNGVIRYDPGTPPVGVRFADPPYAFIGNRFDTQSGAPLSPGTISAISWFQGPVSSKGSVSLMIAPSPSASPLLIGVNAQPSTTNLVSFSPVSVIPSFFVGVFAAAPQNVGTQGSFAQVGFATQSTNSQGFHGSQRTFSGGGGGPLQAPINNQNLLVRVSGNVAIPVELLEFDID